MRSYLSFWLPALMLVGVLFAASCGGSDSAQQGQSNSGGGQGTQDETTGGMQGMAMGMEMVDPSTAGLKVDFSSDPANPQTNQSTALRYFMTDTNSGEVVTDLPIEHEEPMHLVAVSQDLSQFQHIHPEVGADGAYVVTTTFPEAANYVLFNDLVSNEQNVLDRQELNVGQASQKSASLSPDMSPKTQNGLTVSLSAPETIKVGEDESFTLTVTRDKQPVTDLEPYLGAPAHVVIISSDTSYFTHTHGEVSGMESMDSPPPSTFGPDISFDNIFPNSGLYKIWAQFGYQGNVVTVPYVVEVQ